MKKRILQCLSLILCAAMLAIPAAAAETADEEAPARLGPAAYWGTVTWMDEDTFLLDSGKEDGKRGHDTFAGEGFSLELIRRYGIRVSELGDYSMEYDLKTPEQQAEVCNVVRFAIDRSRLTREHLDYVIAAVKELYEDRENIPNMRIVWGHNLPMRHFHAFLEPYPNEG